MGHKTAEAKLAYNRAYRERNKEARAAEYLKNQGEQDGR
jgi:hypothetical protein